MDAKLKHLEFIQSAINRMAANSFYLKGWAVALVSALFALSFKEMEWPYLIVSATALAFMWMLDGYYLAQERAYRKLYDHVRKTSESGIDFSMNASPYRQTFRWHSCAFSITFCMFYGGLILVHGLAFTFIFRSC